MKLSFFLHSWVLYTMKLCQLINVNFTDLELPRNQISGHAHEGLSNLGYLLSRSVKGV